MFFYRAMLPLIAFTIEVAFFAIISRLYFAFWIGPVLLTMLMMKHIRPVAFDMQAHPKLWIEIKVFGQESRPYPDTAGGIIVKTAAVIKIDLRIWIVVIAPGFDITGAGAIRHRGVMRRVIDTADGG